MGSQIRIGQEEQLAGILLTVARFQKTREGEGQCNRSRRMDAHNFKLQHCPGEEGCAHKDASEVFQVVQTQINATRSLQAN